MAKWSKSEKSWERQPGESAKAYEAFEIYLRMGAERSCRKVARQLSKSDTIIRRWSSAWGWQRRIRDYDAELARTKFEEAKKGIQEMQERQIQLAVLLQKKAFDALKKLDILKLTPQEILRFISEGAKLEAANRTAHTQQTEKAQDGGTGGGFAEDIILAINSRKEDTDD